MEIKCHYCKSKDLVIIPRAGDALRRVQVSCMACGAAGPLARIDAEAFEKFVDADGKCEGECTHEYRVCAAIADCSEDNN